MVKKLQTVIGDPGKTEIVFEFMLAFSRFEYSLKRAKFLKKQETAEVDWNAVKNEFENNASKETKNKILSSDAYIWVNPPKKQIVENSALSWKQAQKRSGSIREAIEALQRIRNNLFHGGKWPSGPEYSPERDLKLISCGLQILYDLVDIDADVRNFFFEDF